MKFFIDVVVCNVIGPIGYLCIYFRYQKISNVNLDYKPLLKKDLIEGLDFWILLSPMLGALGLCAYKLNCALNECIMVDQFWIVLPALVKGVITLCVMIHRWKLEKDLNKERGCDETNY